MKKLLLILFFPLVVNGQIYYGENWTNTPAMLTPEVRQMIVQRTVDVYAGCFRNDKYAEDEIDKAPDSEINNVIALHNELRAQGKELKLVYTFDTRGRCSVQDAFYAFDLFTLAGIDIIAARYGNEENGKTAGHPDFNHYKSFCDPITDALNARNFAGVHLFTLGRPDFDSWNDAAEALIDQHSNYSGDIHLYWNQEECAAFDRYLLAGEKGRKDHLPTSTLSTYNATADGFYHDLYFEILQTDLIERTFADFTARFPGKLASITEFGPAGSVGNLGNTLGYEATVDWFLNKIKDYPVFVVCKFNGPSVTGSITNRSNKDLTTLPSYVKRTDHFTQELFNRNKNATRLELEISRAGTYCFSVHNMVKISIDLEEGFVLSEGLIIESFEYEYISGENYYSSSGVTAFWASGAVKTYEIDGIKTSNLIEPLSFGYVHLVVSEADVYGCTDPRALNYDAEANKENTPSTCYYQSDCRCGDPLAENEDLTAPCFDNTLCTYPPQECYRERKIFKFLGCKSDPRCEVNNCNPQ